MQARCRSKRTPTQYRRAGRLPRGSRKSSWLEVAPDYRRTTMRRRLHHDASMMNRLRQRSEGARTTAASAVSIRNVKVSCRYSRTVLSEWLR